jgi:hypothetical protein
VLAINLRAAPSLPRQGAVFSFSSRRECGNHSRYLHRMWRGLGVRPSGGSWAQDKSVVVAALWRRPNLQRPMTASIMVAQSNPNGRAWAPAVNTRRGGSYSQELAGPSARPMLR